MRRQGSGCEDKAQGLSENRQGRRSANLRNEAMPSSKTPSEKIPSLMTVTYAQMHTTNELLWKITVSMHRVVPAGSTAFQKRFSNRMTLVLTALRNMSVNMRSLMNEVESLSKQSSLLSPTIHWEVFPKTPITEKNHIHSLQMSCCWNAIVDHNKPGRQPD